MVRSEGLEPPRCYSLPPQGSASTNSATSAEENQKYRRFLSRRRRRCNKSGTGGQGPLVSGFKDLRWPRNLSGSNQFRQHLLDLDGNPVAVDKHDPARDRERIGQDLDLVR